MGNKKCRIYAACSVSQTPKSSYIIRGGDAMELVLLATASDIDNCLKNIQYYNKFIDYDVIKIITSLKNKKKLEKYPEIELVDENSLMPDLTLKSVQTEFSQMGLDGKRSGWYFQQFLKLAYSRISKYPYYLIWDADTIPVRNITLFSEQGKPIFGMKEEYHKEYFTTIESLFGFSKCSEGSFISEHMIFKCEFVQEIIDEIEKMQNIQGKYFWQKILHAVDGQLLMHGAFSEYETYGTWVTMKYPEEYTECRFISNRYGKSIMGYPPDIKDLNRASKYYDAISFETWDTGIKILDFIRKLDMFHIVPIILYQKVSNRYWDRHFKKCKSMQKNINET